MAFQVGPFQDGTSFAYQQVTGDGGGQVQGGIPGHAGKKRRRYYVEIDGQRFEVANATEAYALLARARAVAERAAELAADKVVEKRTDRPRVSRVALIPPKVTASPELELDLAPIREQLANVYENAAAVAELRLLMLKALADEDEEDAIFLLM